MGYVSALDTEDEHEGWVAMTYADGKVSSATSNGLGHYLDGYTYLPPDPQTGIGGRIDPSYLRPFDQVTGWLPRCECGWQGVEVPLPDEHNRWHEPSDAQEDLVMGQWRLHIRQELAEKIPAV